MNYELEMTGVVWSEGYLTAADVFQQQDVIWNTSWPS